MKTIRRNTEGFVIWLTGLPASGKTSLADAIKRVMSRLELPLVVIDSDEMRELLTPTPTFESEERDYFYNTLGSMAIWLARSGVNVIIAATANKREYRDRVRDEIDRFGEIYVDCALEICQARDPKGIYAKAGNNNLVPGMGIEYEPPLDPELAIDTGRLFPKQAAFQIVEKLIALEILEIDKEKLKDLFPPPFNKTGSEFAYTPHI